MEGLLKYRLTIIYNPFTLRVISARIYLRSDIWGGIPYMCLKGAVRILILMLVSAVFFSACAGNSGVVSKETGKTGEIEQKKQNNVPPTTFNFYINYGWWLKTDWGKDLTSKEITRLTGVSLNIDKPSNNEESVTRLNMMLSTGNYPDMIMMVDSALSKKLVQKGMFIPLNDYIDKYGTDIKKNVGMDYLKEYCTEDDGKIYGLPNGIAFAGQAPDSGEGILLLKGVYERLGSPPLNTIDDLYNYLVKVKESGLKNKNGESIIPSNFDWPTKDLSGPFGVRFVSIDGGSYVYGSDRVLRQVMRVPEMKDIFYFTSKLFREKLIDQEWLLQDGETINKKIKSGRYAMYFATNAYGLMDEATDTVKKNSDDSFIMVKMPLAPGVQDPKYNLVIRKPWTMIYMTTKCKDPKKAMEFLNWEASEKGQYLSRLGPEGVVWNEGPDGTPLITPSFSKKLSADKEAALSDAGYMKWNFMQNNKFLENSVIALMSPVERNERRQRGKIITDSMWFAPELEQLSIDPASKPGIANVKINNYFGNADRKMYMALDDATFESLYNAALPDMEKLGLNDLEDELNRQIREALNK
jgi:putative aldouronate transport system substrate-binding protein